LPPLDLKDIHKPYDTQPTVSVEQGIFNDDATIVNFAI